MQTPSQPLPVEERIPSIIFPLWPAGHLPHKGGEDSRQRLLSMLEAVQRVKPLPLVGRGWGGV
ncbi:hypothetical protein YH62_12165 [Rhizobium sp. LC145]|nr:hypothetical protein YH62_12165 [Rhizobium sp. LC145]